MSVIKYGTRCNKRRGTREGVKTRTRQMIQVGLHPKVPYSRIGTLFHRYSKVGGPTTTTPNLQRWVDQLENGSCPTHHIACLVRTSNTKWYSSTSTGNGPSTSVATTSSDVVSSSPPIILPLDVPPKLQVIPTLPYVGSQLTFISGMPQRKPDNEYGWQLEMRAKYGDFYSYGIPGLGAGTHGIVYTISDPREYMNVIRQEGRYPFGLASFLWPMKRYCTEKDMTVARGDDGGLFGRSDDWKVIRNFLQTDLLSPQAANGYISGIITAAEYASKGAPSSTDELNQYLNRCSFDLFCTIMFGELLHVADPNTPTDPVNLEFIKNAVIFLNLNSQMLTDVKEFLTYSIWKSKSDKYKQFEAAADNVFRISREKVQQFQQKYDEGTLDEYQRDSYLANAIRRQREQAKNPVTGEDSIITEEMMIDICVFLLTGSVDTTSGVMAFALMHMALNPEVQEKLYQEIRNSVVSKETGRLTADVITKRAVAPYLHAVLRESHRLTPTTPNSILKEVASETQIHGVTIPAKSMVVFNNYAVQMDPVYIDDPESFRPERWLPDAVDARKGTPYEVMDHPFYKDPFSQGARKCPGSRVAINEVLCFLSQLVLDYEIRAPSNIQSYKDIPTTLMGVRTPILPKFEFIPRQR